MIIFFYLALHVFSTQKIKNSAETVKNLNDQQICNGNLRCVHKFTTVYIYSTFFTNYITSDSKGGGAIQIESCSLICNETNFNYCTAKNSNGGAILVNNTKSNLSIIISNCIFNSCSSKVQGGAVYINDILNSSVNLFNNIFKDNFIISEDQQGSNQLFISASNSIIKNCSFSNLKSKPNGKLLQFIQNGQKTNNQIINCSFVYQADELKSSSIIDLFEKQNSNPILISHSYFILNQNNFKYNFHYINSNTTITFKHKNFFSVPIIQAFEQSFVNSIDKINFLQLNEDDNETISFTSTYDDDPESSHPLSKTQYIILFSVIISILLMIVIIMAAILHLLRKSEKGMKQKGFNDLPESELNSLTEPLNNDSNYL